ncbi:MAG: hypothetical protein ACUVXJ_10970 [Phycisphaerae bacterium]
MTTAEKICVILAWPAPMVIILPGCRSLESVRPNEHLIVDLVDEFRLDQPSESWQLTSPDAWRIGSDGQRRFLQVTPLSAGPDKQPPAWESAIHRKYRFRSFSFSGWLRLEKAVGNRRCSASIVFGWQNDRNCLRLDLSDLDGKADVALVQVTDDRVIRLAAAPLSSRSDFTLKKWHQIGMLRNLDTAMVEVYIDEADKPVLRARTTAYEWGRLGLASTTGGASFGRVMISGEALPTQ